MGSKRQRIRQRHDGRQDTDDGSRHAHELLATHISKLGGSLKICQDR